MKVGDQVRIVAVPASLPPDSDNGGLNTAVLFKRCLARVFPVVGLNELGYAELDVGEVTGQPSYMASIWIEPQFLVVMENGS
jgi:hypothetical protein